MRNLAKQYMLAVVKIGKLQAENWRLKKLLAHFQNDF